MIFCNWFVSSRHNYVSMEGGNLTYDFRNDPLIKGSPDGEMIVRLIEAAIEKAKKAYQPYTGYCVGAAIMTAKGNIFAGFNMENAACEGGPHAETAALIFMLDANESNPRFVVCIGYAESPDGEPDITIGLSSCGGCRQKLYDFQSLHGSDIQLIHRTSESPLLMISSLDVMLPHAFGPADLGINLTRHRRG